ncbi:MAG: hypothetical protein U0996_00935 [Planctomycetaceae bacterium]
MAKRSQDDDVPQDFHFLQQDSETLPSDHVAAPPDFSNVVAGNTVPYMLPPDNDKEHTASLPSVTIAESEVPAKSTSVVIQSSPVVAENQSQSPAAGVSPATSRDESKKATLGAPAASRESSRSFAPPNESALSLTRSSRQPSAILTGYAVAVTMILLFLFLTGKVSLFGTHPLESLPDIKPLAPNEFKRVPENAALPEGHVLKLGESKRFGDVVVTPLKVTREPLTFEEFRTAAAAPNLATEPVLRLWLQFKNVATEYAFAPFDADLMSSRFPQLAVDESAQVNSFLRLNKGGEKARVLNFLQSSDSNFVLTGQNSGKLIAPGEELLTFVASEEMLPALAESSDTSASWRVQFRKGVNVDSGNGVTTLIDVAFSLADISDVQQTATPQ